MEGVAGESITAPVRPLLDSPLDVWIHRPIGKAIARALVKSPTTPNQLTVIATGFGLLAAWLFWPGDPGKILLGLLSIWVWVVLDHTDGDLARLRGVTSEFGSKLDRWSDRVVLLALLSSIFARLFLSLKPADRLLGAALMLGGIALVFAVAIALDERLRRLGRDEMPDQGKNLFEALTGRDIFYFLGFGYWICALRGEGALRWYFWFLAWAIQLVWIATAVVWKIWRPKTG